MPLPERIQDLTDRIQDDLRAGYDYFEHTKVSLGLFQRIVERGHKITVQNMVTGTVVNETSLGGLARSYVATYLAESAFQHFISLFEDFVFELLRLWLSAYPSGIPNKDKKPVDLATIIDAADKDAILTVVIDRELNALKYERPTSWFRYLNDRVKLGCPTDEQIERLAEIKASRDILVHNRGIVNETYVLKSQARARGKVGQRLEISGPYLRETWLLIGEIVRDLAAATIAKAS
ncbi:MAG: hypothetical protein ACLQGP_04200 [Isosphaeraceae bacterium]